MSSPTIWLPTGVAPGRPPHRWSVATVLTDVVRSRRVPRSRARSAALIASTSAVHRFDDVRALRPRYGPGSAFLAGCCRGVSPDLISTSRAVLESPPAARPLGPCIPSSFSCPAVVRDGVVRKPSICPAVLPTLTRHPRLWFSDGGAKFWMKVFSDLKPEVPRHPHCRHRRLRVSERWPRSSPRRRCRRASSISFAESRLRELEERKPMQRTSRSTARRAPSRRAALDAFDRARGPEVPDVVRPAPRLTHVIPFFAFPPESGRWSTRRTRWRASMRSCARSSRRAALPTDEAATKLICCPRYITAKWVRGRITAAAMNQFAILYEGRFTKPAV